MCAINPRSSCLYCFLSLVALAPTCARSGLFEAFPRVDDRQLAVYDGDILQVIGTAAASSVVSVLRNARDAGFQPLLVSSEDPDKPQRALLSVGIADFRNTSAGAYRELVIAFPACARDEAPVLECRSFATCQSQLPDCAHTYMFRSFVSKQAALWVARSFGVDAQIAAVFDFVHEPNGVIRFTILGPGNSEIFQGAIKKDNRTQQASGDVEATNQTQRLSRDGYEMHPYVGIPGVLGPGQARYVCAFSKALSVVPVATAGPLHVGKLLGEFDFQPEGIFHIANASVMQMPPIGYQTAGPMPASSGTAATRHTARGEDPRVGAGLRQFMSGGQLPSSDNGDDDVEDCSNGCGPRIPWKQQDGNPGSTKDGENNDFPWTLYKDAARASSASTEPTATHRPRTSSTSSRTSGQRSTKSAGLSTLLSEL